MSSCSSSRCSWPSWSPDPAALLANRPQRDAWVVVAAIAVAIVTLIALFRRAETAVYRAFGLPMHGVLIAAQVETAALVAAAYLAAVAWTGSLFVPGSGVPGWDQAALALRTAGKAALATAVVAPVLAAVAGSGSPASLLKER